MKNHIVAKELSWLAFNDRVLQEAANEKTPVFERLRYLGIFSNNQDEFFRVKVADVSRLAAFSATADEKERYNKLLEDIQSSTRKQQKRFNETYLEILRVLHKRKIYLIEERQLDKQQGDYVESFFTDKVLPELDPVLLDSGRPFPEIMDGYIYLAVRLVTDNQVRYAIVDVPTDRVDRFIQIPQKKGRGGKVFIVLENVIRYCLPKIFRGVFEISEASAYVFKLTLDADLELGDGINQSLIDKMAVSLKKRRMNDPERFVYDSEMPVDLLDFLRKKLKLGKYDSQMPGGRYHNAKDFINFPSVGPAYLDMKPLPPIPLKDLAENRGSLLELIRQQDRLFYYPYQSFNRIIELLKTAAIDPMVKSIHISLYRVSKSSRVVDALLSAVSNNKKVTAVVELQARFDEAANIDWARRLTEGGVNVIFGVPGLKVHSKLFVISRQESNDIRYYTHVGTGNFNEKTSSLYTDFSLLTYNQDIGQDAINVFDFISYNYRRHDFKELMVSPHTFRDGISRLIEQEIHNAEQGLSAAIMLKCNNLVDQPIIDLLCQASCAGVRVRIICRGMCCLLPGVKGISENIEIISIVDRFLEHPRVYVFHNKGEPQYYISSADLMTRNLDHRVEVTVPIKDVHLKQRIQDILDIQWCDTVKARDIVTNTTRKNLINAKLRSQEAIHDYFLTGHVPGVVTRARKKWAKHLALAAKKRAAKLTKVSQHKKR